MPASLNLPAEGGVYTTDIDVPFHISSVNGCNAAFVSLYNQFPDRISIPADMGAPIQFDAVLGYVNAVQEMILYSSEKLVKLLPTLPDIMTKGRTRNWHFVGGSINMAWDMDKCMFTAELKADRNIAIDIKLPPGYDNLNWSGDCVVGRKGNLLGIRMKNNSKRHIFQA